MASPSPYDKIVDLIKQLDLQDDGIVMNQKIKSIEQDFCTVVLDENMLSESMEYINEQVLNDKDASLKFALLFSSRSFDSLAMNDTKVRYKMLNILQNNFLNADQYRSEHKERFYNSITLLGEYYHRVRLADGSPIAILGESLLDLLTKEVRKLNDNVERPQKIDVKLAKLILSQITLNGSIMRSTHKDEINTLLYHIRRNIIEVPDLKPPAKALLLMTLDLYYNNFSNLGEMLEDMYTKYLVEEEAASSTQDDSLNNFENGNEDTGSEYEPKKKWSEQVCEDIVYENDVNDYCDQPLDDRLSSDNCSAPLREQSSSRSNVGNNYPNRYNSSATNYDDDRHSVRSEGGSIRLYSVNDRLKYHQRGNGNGGGNNQNNWDRPYHTFDRSRRSNSRNRGQYDNYQNKNNNNNRGYQRPPRFNKNNDSSWRNSSDTMFNRGGSRGPESNSRSSSRNRNLPRPPRGNFENFNGRSLSPEARQRGGGYPRNNNGNQQHPQQHRQQSRNFGNSRNNRYSSHSSLASDSGTWERRGRHRDSRGKSQEYYSRDDNRSIQDREENNWDDENNELVKNARNTTKYMQYLSKK